MTTRRLLLSCTGFGAIATVAFAQGNAIDFAAALKSSESGTLPHKSELCARLPCANTGLGMKTLRISAGRHGALRFDSLDDGVGEFRGAGGSTDIASEFAAVAVDLIDGIANLQ